MQANLLRMAVVAALCVSHATVAAATKRHVNDNPVSHKIIKSLTGLCADMEIACVVEGVETRAQLDSLRRLGCDYIQGYYFAKPMKADAVAGHLADESRQPGLHAEAATLVPA